MDDIEAFFGPPVAVIKRSRGRPAGSPNKVAKPAPVTAPAESKRGRGRPPLPPEQRKPQPVRMNPEQLQAFRVANLAKARAARAAASPLPAVETVNTPPATVYAAGGPSVAKVAKGIRKPLDPATRIKLGKDAPAGAAKVRECQALFNKDEAMTIAEARETAEMMLEFPNGDRDDILGRWGIASGYFVTV